MADSSCEIPAWNEATAQFLTGNRIYRDILGAAPSRRSVEVLKRRIRIDLKTRYTFWTMSNITRADEHIWIVPMHAGPFAEDRDEIARRIERLWKSDSDRILIQWEDNPAPDTFRFLFDLSVGARPGTSYPNHTVTLPNGMFATSLPHEIGHVLGFRDRYFELWDALQCGYRSRAHGADLMSRARSGLVLPAHWEELRKQYPLK